ncbi:MAG: hypothetical protein EON58_13835 [Alphaproteobacteria bacterium]|nr:MAG: hypothetical protein EON58_13835 [Alphaproteobacteria bacterium]
MSAIATLPELALVISEHATHQFRINEYRRLAEGENPELREPIHVIVHTPRQSCTPFTAGQTTPRPGLFSVTVEDFFGAG